MHLLKCLNCVCISLYMYESLPVILLIQIYFITNRNKCITTLVLSRGLKMLEVFNFGNFTGDFKCKPKYMTLIIVKILILQFY